MESEKIQSTLENLNKLPINIQSHIDEIHSMDAEIQKIQRTVNEMAHEYLRDVATLSHQERIFRIRATRDQMRRGRQLADAKVDAAEKAYELVDSKIRQLDHDLHIMETEIRAKRRLQAHATKDPADSVKDVKEEKRKSKKDTLASIKKHLKFNKKPSKATASLAALREKLKKGSKNSKSHLLRAVQRSGKEKSQSSQKQRSSASALLPVTTEEVYHKSRSEVASMSSGGDRDIPSSVALTLAITNNPAEVLDMPVDPNEPIYCLCRQVSHGQMVACDNPTCAIEWFHFGCVGLSSAPKGRWYCPSCRQMRRLNFSTDALLST